MLSEIAPHRIPTTFRTAPFVPPAPFVITFWGVATLEPDWPVDLRYHRRPLALLADGDALFELFRLLDSGLRQNGLRAAEKFTPHMTLLYGPNSVPRQAIEPIRLVVKEFVLIHSERGLTRHNIIDRWALAA
jgi:2'-5' RNA ligase